MTLHEFSESESQIFIIMDKFIGRPLFDRLTMSEGVLGVELVKSLTIKMINFLKYIHNKGYVYRDVKLENFLYNGKELKVMDFSLAVKLKRGKSLSQIVGSPYYIAPEILKEKYDHRVDIWSLGVCIYVLLKGHYPFSSKGDSENTTEIFENILEMDIDFEKDNELGG
jgi:calcium-dependent protein kinase